MVKGLKHAYKFFNIFKCLAVDLVLSFQERQDSRKFFLGLSAKEAFKVISMELNFLYDVLYTKAAIVHSLRGYVIRATCSAGIAASFLMFFYFNNDVLYTVDVSITYTLLIGTVAVDILGVAMLVFSDWTVVSWLGSCAVVRKSLAPVVTGSSKKRWSEVTSQLDLIQFCLKEVPVRRRWFLSHCCLRQCRTGLEKMATMFGIDEMLNEVIYSYRMQVKPELLEFIFQELKSKSEDAEELKASKKLIEYKGWKVLENHRIEVGGDNDPLRKSVETEFDECILLWHIATDLCYHADKEEEEKEANGTRRDQAAGDSGEGSVEEAGKGSHLSHREMCKQLSDYMLYLLVMQPVLMSTIAGIGLLRYRDTCAQAKMFFGTSGQNLELGDACKMLWSVTTEAAKPAEVKGDRSKSVLFDGCILAKRLSKLVANPAMRAAEVTTNAAASGEFKVEGQELAREEMWKVMAKVWVELLSYAACHCSGIEHGRKLSTGAELLNLVWFLMAHLGLSNQFRTYTGEA